MNDSKGGVLPPMSANEFLIRMSNLPFLLSRGKNILWGMWCSIGNDEFSKIYREIRPYTMCWNIRLHGLYHATKRVERQNIYGDLVECGTAEGGSAALLGLTLNALNSTRKLWVFDTFEGLPAPTPNDPDQHIAHNYTGSCRGEFEAVQSLFQRLGTDSRTKMVKGLFQSTLLDPEVQKIAVLHIDGDWYDSVKVCLEQLYDRVAIGGTIQIDDYGYWAGARKAVDEFRQLNRINDPLVVLDYEGRQWIKTTERTEEGKSQAC